MKTNFRIVLKWDGKYYPQYRCLWFWRHFGTRRFDPISECFWFDKEHFSSIEEATDWLEAHIKSTAKSSVPDRVVLEI